MKTSETTDDSPLSKDAPFLGAYRGRRVLVTGHTGFKGTWLCAWLRELGAEVAGYALTPSTAPSAFELCRLSGRLDHRLADIRDADAVARTIDEFRPEFIFHMAAQTLVRRSYREPVDTFDTNVMGTVNLLEAVRRSEQPSVVLAVTSDKCYREVGEHKQFVETDPLGGSDPYAASKGCAELVVSAYRRSFFPVGRHAEHGVVLASVRAGNVIGGGDWAEDRLVPDIVRALTAGAPARIRNPKATRPWQHVLDPLSGYLWLGARMLREGADGLAEAWNFGPARENAVSVRELAGRIVQVWGAGHLEETAEPGGPHEAESLGLCCDKAASRLRWRPVYELDAAVEATVAWYKRARECPDMLEFTVGQIGDYMRRARAVGAEWAGSHTEAATA